MSKEHLQIAIDGPGGAGKSTVSKAVAARLGIVYVDTGALYRTVGYYVRTQNTDPKDREAVSALLPNINIEVRYENGAQHVYLNGEDLGDRIRTPEMSMYASAVSAIPEVRAFLLNTQKDIAAKNSVIMDGRDIGTVILPNADLKIYLTASAECRARRRYDELIAKGQQVNFEDVLREMNERDENDSTREAAPAVAAEDAILFDNTGMGLEETVERIIALANEASADEVDTKKKKKTGSKIYRAFYAVAADIVGLIFRIRVIGRENEPDEGGFMVCANHTSATDPVVICYAFRKHQVRFMAKKELFRVPVVNWLVGLMGAFPVDRSGNDVGAIKRSVAMLKDGECMGIFPQGHRYPAVDPRTTETKNGAALICTKAEANIVPAYIVRKNNTHKLFRRTWVVIGEPIPFSSLGYDKDAAGEYARITDLVFDRICALGESFDEEEAKKILKEMKKK